MNIFRHYKNQKTRAQAMMEFALVLPILLVLIYGLLETGRLLFIYASTITAARQAARYGSATGDNPDGIPYYNDCAGIEAAAERVGFINVFDSVTISYDGGLDNLGDPIALAPPPTDPACENFIPTGNGNRIIVEVTAQWSPIVPIVPLKPFVISSTSERTILTSVDIYVAADPPDFNAAGDGKPYLESIVPNPTTYSVAGQVIHYTYNLRNSGLGDLVNPTIVDDKITVDCGAITVIPGATFTCTGDYVITQADLDAGSFKNKAYPTGWPANTLSAVIYADKLPAISLAKSGSPAAASKVGKIITYTYIITNTGNVTLKAPFTVSDDQIPVTCSDTADIAPGATTTCNGTDEVTDQDIDNGQIVNQATANAVFNSTTLTSNTATFTVLTPPLLLEVTPPPIVSAPGVGTYNFILTNDTDFDATGVVVSDTRVSIDGSCPNNVPAQSSRTCTGTYTFTQADIDAGVSISSLTVVKATMNSKAVTSNPVTVEVGISQTKTLTAALVGTPSDDQVDAGDTILYTYTLTNSGNTTLKTPIAVTDTIGTTITCADQSDFVPLSPSRTCTGTYTVTDIDAAAGMVTTTGTATATFNNGTPETISATPITLSTITFNGPRFNIGVAANFTTVTALNSAVEFTYTFTNTGSVDLTSPYTITSSLTPITFDCSLAAPSIAPGSSTSCKGIYTVTTMGNKTNTVTGATATYGATTVNANNIPQSATVTVLICSPTTVPLSFNNSSGTTKIWTIVNNSGAPVTISTIHIAWPSNRRLQNLTFASPSTTIYSGNPGDGSGDKTYNGPWAIASGATATVTATFNNNTTISDFTLTFSQLGCSGTWSNP